MALIHTLKLTEARRQAALKFLSRAELKAREIPEFTDLFKLIESSKPDPDPGPPSPSSIENQKSKTEN